MAISRLKWASKVLHWRILQLVEKYFGDSQVSADYQMQGENINDLPTGLLANTKADFLRMARACKGRE